MKTMSVRLRTSGTWTWLRRVRSRVCSFLTWAASGQASAKQRIRYLVMGLKPWERTDIIWSAMRLRFGLAFVLACVGAPAQRAPLFKDEILPILEKSCTQCHSARQKMG